MEKEFIPYEQALALKELGFDEKCISVYLTHSKQPYPIYRPYTNNENTDEVLRPTFSQAFRFFREKFRLHSFIDIYPTNDEPDRCWYMIRHYDRSVGDDKDIVSGFFVNQEKAELGCLIRLINIVKEQK